MEKPEESELHGILTAHAARYPRMRPADAVKLLYQQEFGGGHLVTDPADSLVRLRTERAAVKSDPSAPLFEELGGGVVRVMLEAQEEANYPLEQLNRDFIRSAELRTGDRERFRNKLDWLRDWTRRGELPFSAEELEAWLESYEAAGCPPVSHSAEYRQAYHPAYRVLLRARSLPHLIQTIQRRSGEGGRVLVALDGRCASGKTTLAQQLRERFGWSVVHLDHFFLRPEQRTPERYAAPGENVDHERFLQEVLEPLRAGQTPEYRPFDCHTQTLLAPVRVAESPVILVEGSYSCHPALWPYYDLRVFLTVSQAEQSKRILARNGPEYAQVFQKRWIPLEEAYFAAYRLETRCDYTLEL